MARARARRLEQWRERHPAPPGTVRDVADHIDYLRRLAGVDHVGIEGRNLLRAMRAMERVAAELWATTSPSLAEGPN